MKSVFIIWISFTFSLTAFAQYAYHPMTAPGAVSIFPLGHILYWENPDSVYFNIIYFSEDSSLVANQDPSAIILSGEPATVYDSVQISTDLSINTKYYWCVVEYYLIGDGVSRNAFSPIWYFHSFPGFNDYQYYFYNDLEGWQAIGPQGVDNWYWSNTTHTWTGSPGEMVFSKDPLFTGNSYIISPEVIEPVGFSMTIDFHFYLNFNLDTAIVKFGITTDNGVTWDSLWGLHATGNVGPDLGYAGISVPGNFRMGFYYTGNSENINYFYVDNVTLSLPLTIPSWPPSLLKARASHTEKKVTLNWNPGSAIQAIIGYLIQRQDGLPEDANPYITIAQTGSDKFSYVDTSINLNENYTYRVSTISSHPGYWYSHYSNEATAYVPPVTPVELVIFNANAENNSVSLKWTTSTETNNKGFDVERKSVPPNQWSTIGFVEGNGTSTEIRNYSFTDDNVASGKYAYRLKQIDFDGSYKYSNIVEVEVNKVTEFSLSQNYPNPFNPSTKIKFSIPGEMHVNLSVYNILGEKVRELKNELMEPGYFEINFDGSELTSGVYLYCISATSIDGQTENFVQTRKMLLLK